MTVILGCNAFHADSAACLVIDGVLVGAVAEERLGSRQKHTSAFPRNAIRRLLSDNGLRLRDVTHVAFARDVKANFISKARYVMSRPLDSAAAVFEHIARRGASENLHRYLASICEEDSALINFKVVNVEHHLAHISSAYYLSPFDSLTAGFSYDGSGDFVSMMAAKCEGNKISVLDKVALPNSLGFFYTALCQYIGFENFGEEYKVMGLAPYGMNAFNSEMRSLIKIEKDGWFKLNPRYFRMHNGGKSDQVGIDGRPGIDLLYKSEICELLGEPIKGRNAINQRQMDMAKSIQVRFEEISLHCMRRLHSLVPSNQLAMAGGCALNGVTNARILKETPFRRQFIQPASSDDGTCIGAAYHTWHQVLGRKERFEMKHSFWGPKYSRDEVMKVVKNSPYLFAEAEDEDEVTSIVSGMLAEGLVVGWYQGASEWGPRALGHRSILANPTIPSMKETINLKIKRRESFRPFAPSVLLEDVSKYFEEDISSPFMMHVVKFKEEWRAKLPAVTHVDGTGRLQTVDENSNYLYHKLIKSFKTRTGYGILLNTSFNENEPVVDTPQQAYDCFNRTDMDALCIENFILKK